MGGGGEKKKTNSMLDTQNRQAQAEHTDYMGAVNKGLSGSQDRASDMYKSMYGGLDRFTSGGGDYDPTKYGSLNDFTDGGGGGAGGDPGGVGAAAADPRFGEAEGSYRNFMGGGGVNTGTFDRLQGNLVEIGESGGWDAGRRASMDQNIQGFKDIGRTGGVDAEGQARMRGSGVFDEFAKTGGLSDIDRSRMRARGASTVPAFYDAAKQEAGRASALQGGYGPGQSALMGRMSREGAAEAAKANRETELGISDQVMKGRQWGGTNIASSEGALQGLLSSNRLAGLTGASTTEANMLNSIAQNRTGAATAGAGNEVGMQGVIQKGKMFGTQGLEGMAESAADRAARASAASGAAGALSAAQRAANAKWQAEFDRGGRQYGLEGMQSLYGSAPGEVDMYLGAHDTGQGRINSTGGRIVDQRMTNNPQRDWAQTIGSFVGAAGGAMTGLGALGVGAKAAKVAGAASDVNLKQDIRPISGDIIQQFMRLPISTWAYKTDPAVRHLGPMAQDMKRVFDVGDGVTIELVDVMGLLMLLGRAVAEKAARE